MTEPTPEAMLALIAAGLVGRTDAADRIYIPATWATRTADMPMILVRYARHDRAALGRGEIQFTATDTIQIMLYAAELASGDDGAVLAAEAEAWRVQRQIEVAVVGNQDLIDAIQQFPYLRTEVFRSSEAQVTLVGVNTELGLEYYQGPEHFVAYEGPEVATDPLPDLDEVRIDTRQGGLDPEDLQAGPIASAITLG